MTAINENALAKFSGILEVAPSATPSTFTRVASVRDLVAILDTAANTVEVETDDNGVVFKGYTPEGRIEGEFLEVFDRDLLEILLGGTTSDTAASLVAGATQTEASGAWGYDDPIVIENQNGDGSELTINSVTGGTDGLLVEGTDYFVGQDANGDTVVTIVDSATVTTESQDMVIDYDYTPNASEDITWDLDFTESETFVARITATDPSGNTRVVTLSEAAFEGQLNMSFLDVVRNGDIQGATFVLKGNKGSTMSVENEIL